MTHNEERVPQNKLREMLEERKSELDERLTFLLNYADELQQVQDEMTLVYQMIGLLPEVEEEEVEEESQVIVDDSGTIRKV